MGEGGGWAGNKNYSFFPATFVTFASPYVVCLLGVKNISTMVIDRVAFCCSAAVFQIRAPDIESPLPTHLLRYRAVDAHGYIAKQLANQFVLDHFECPCGNSIHVSEEDGEVIRIGSRTLFLHLLRSRELTQKARKAIDLCVLQFPFLYRDSSARRFFFVFVYEELTNGLVVVDNQERIAVTILNPCGFLLFRLPQKVAYFVC